MFNISTMGMSQSSFMLRPQPEGGGVLVGLVGVSGDEDMGVGLIVPLQLPIEDWLVSAPPPISNISCRMAILSARVDLLTLLSAKTVTVGLGTSTGGQVGDVNGKEGAGALHSDSGLQGFSKEGEHSVP